MFVEIISTTKNNDNILLFIDEEVIFIKLKNELSNVTKGKKNFNHYSRVKNGLLPRIRTFREITFFMLCVTRIFKSYFQSLRAGCTNAS
jgi:hypothetical protein